MVLEPIYIGQVAVSRKLKGTDGFEQKVEWVCKDEILLVDTGINYVRVSCRVLIFILAVIG